MVSACLLMTGSCGKESAVTDPGSRITITGTVIDFTATPCPGMTVRVPGHADVTTAIDGSFTILGVATPYNIAVIDAGGTDAIISVGLTMSSPTLVTLGDSQKPRRTSTVNVIAPRGRGLTTLVILAGDEFCRYGNVDSTATWTVSSAVSADTVECVAYVFRYASGPAAVSCDGWARKTVGIRVGGTTTVEFMAGEMSDPAEADITGEILLPVGQPPTILEAYAATIECHGWRVHIAGVARTGPQFTLRMPAIPDLTYALIAHANSVLGISDVIHGGLPPGTTGVRVALSGVPAMVSPAENATDIDAQQNFTWATPTSTGRSYVVFYGANAPRISIITTASSFPLSILTSFGISLSAGTSYFWQMSYQPWMNTMDATAERKNVLAWCRGISPNAGEATTLARTFRTR